MSNTPTEYDIVMIDGRRFPGALRVPGAPIVNNDAADAWLDAVVLGVGFYHEPIEALASRDPGQER